MKGAVPDPAWAGGLVSERAHCVLCHNPSPMTLDGTNTWVLAEPGSSDVVVVDPGPLDEGHLQTVLHHVAETGRRVALTLLTHGHDDHAESADRFHQLTGAPVRAFGRGHDDIRAGETITLGGLEILAVETPTSAGPDGKKWALTCGYRSMAENRREIGAFCLHRRWAGVSLPLHLVVTPL